MKAGASGTSHSSGSKMWSVDSEMKLSNVGTPSTFPENIAICLFTSSIPAPFRPSFAMSMLEVVAMILLALDSLNRSQLQHRPGHSFKSLTEMTARSHLRVYFSAPTSTRSGSVWLHAIRCMQLQILCISFKYGYHAHVRKATSSFSVDETPGTSYRLGLHEGCSILTSSTRRPSFCSPTSKEVVLGGTMS